MIDITKTAVLRQVAAMSSQDFEIGILDPNHQDAQGEIVEQMIIKTWPRNVLEQPGAIAYLRSMNARGRHIYIRPAGEHCLTLLDDLDAEKVRRMREAGLQPALVVETSPGNLQAWIRHRRPLPAALGTEVSRIVAAEFGGDPGSADWRHFGRLAGFTNRKIKYQDERGRFPYVKLREAAGCTYSAHDRLLSRAEEVLTARRAAEQLAAASRQASTQGAAWRPVKSIEDFARDPRYVGDLTRSDLAYATYAIARGASDADVWAAIQARDLAHKGSSARQAAYIERTIAKAKTMTAAPAAGAA